MTFTTNYAEHAYYTRCTQFLNLLGCFAAVTYFFGTDLFNLRSGFSVLVNFGGQDYRIIFPFLEVLEALVIYNMHVLASSSFPDLDLATFRQAIKQRAIWANTLIGAYSCCRSVTITIAGGALSVGIEGTAMALAFSIYCLQRLLYGMNLVGGHRTSLLHSYLFWLVNILLNVLSLNAYSHGALPKDCITAIASYQKYFSRLQRSTTLCLLGISYGSLTHIMLDYLGTRHRPYSDSSFKEFAVYYLSFITLQMALFGLSAGLIFQIIREVLYDKASLYTPHQ